MVCLDWPRPIQTPIPRPVNIGYIITCFFRVYITPRRIPIPLGSKSIVFIGLGLSLGLGQCEDTINCVGTELHVTGGRTRLDTL